MLAAITPIQIIFYVFAAIAVISATVVVTARNPVRSVLSLVITFFAMAGVWMLLNAEFLSIILLLVYVGAVMTLFLFVVMMLNIDREKTRGGFVKYLPIGLIFLVLLFGIVLVAIHPSQIVFSQADKAQQLPTDYNNIQALGYVLFTEFVYPFEIAGVILLTAIIAAITLSYRRPRRKVQDVAAQVSVSPKERLRIVRMAAEPRVFTSIKQEPKSE